MSAATSGSRPRHFPPARVVPECRCAHPGYVSIRPTHFPRFGRRQRRGRSLPDLNGAELTRVSGVVASGAWITEGEPTMRRLEVFAAGGGGVKTVRALGDPVRMLLTI